MKVLDRWRFRRPVVPRSSRPVPVTPAITRRRRFDYHHPSSDPEPHKDRMPVQTSARSHSGHCQITDRIPAQPEPGSNSYLPQHRSRIVSQTEPEPSTDRIPLRSQTEPTPIPDRTDTDPGSNPSPNQHRSGPNPQLHSHRRARIHVATQYAVLQSSWRLPHMVTHRKNTANRGGKPVCNRPPAQTRAGIAFAQAGQATGHGNCQSRPAADRGDSRRQSTDGSLEARPDHSLSLALQDRT